MLTMISTNKAAAARAGFGAGTCPPDGLVAAAPSAASAAVPGGPRTGRTVGILRPVRTGPDQAAPRPGLRQQYLHTTRIAVPSGAAAGPHQPRDPV